MVQGSVSQDGVMGPPLAARGQETSTASGKQPTPAPERPASRCRLLGARVGWSLRHGKFPELLSRGLFGHGHPGCPRPAMGKTGTSDDEKDLWMTGATPLYAGAIWMGYEISARVGGTAGDLVSPLWGWWMRALEEGLEPAEFVGPVLDRHGICTQSGLAANGSSGSSPCPGGGVSCSPDDRRWRVGCCRWRFGPSSRGTGTGGENSAC